MKLSAEQNELLDLRDRVHELDETVQQLRKLLRREIGLVLPPAWQMNRLEQGVLIILAKAAPVAIPRQRILDKLTAAGLTSSASVNSVAVHMCRLRSKIVASSLPIEIVTNHTFGIWISTDAAKFVLASATEVEL
jgi:hypothetical protein